MSILLAQHKAELGNKEIYQVNVVSDSKSLKPFAVTELHMFFQIRDAPPPKEPESDKLAVSENGNGVVARRDQRGSSSYAHSAILPADMGVIGVQDLSGPAVVVNYVHYIIQTGTE